MNFAVVLFVCGLVACSRAGPVPPALNDIDIGNQVVTGIVEFMFNGSGCVQTCDKNGACPTGNTLPTETNLRACVDCVMKCSPEVQCYTKRGITAAQVGDGVTGLLDALYLDGCKLAETSKDCVFPMSMALFFQGQKNLPATPQGCPDPSTMPAPPMSDADRTKTCDYLKCSNEKTVANPKCKRGVPALTAMHMMSSSWLHCLNAAGASTVKPAAATVKPL